jgi:carbamoyltransferase
MKILGINSVYHESAAALVVDGELVAASEEERFNRRKHAKPASVDNADELPRHAIAHVLAAGSVEPHEVDAIAYSFDPAERRLAFRVDALAEPEDWGTAEGERRFRSSLGRVPASLRDLLGGHAGEILTWVPHHLAHAASAYYPSGSEEAAILVVDGIAENASVLFARGHGHSIEPLATVDYPHSLGFVWEKLSKFLGFSEYDACKVMGLAAYGDPTRYAAVLHDLVAPTPDGFRCDAAKLAYRLRNFDGLVDLGAPRSPDEPLDQRHADVAAALQQTTNEILLALVERTARLCPSDELCLAGGVTLNCTSNWLLKEQGHASRVYIPPAAHDAGTAIGAALLVHALRTGARPVATSNPYVGPAFDSAAISGAAQESGFEVAEVGDAAPRVAADLVDRGQVVGWFQGAMEFGPRALGNRSLLADPRDPATREVLNRKVKHREDFRPFAPSVLEEQADEWFDLGRASTSYEYMLFACPVRPGRRGAIPAVVHADGTARVQVVRRAANPRFHELIRRFAERTGVPLVLNTSFNDSEPIVCSPRDALNTFAATRIDALVMGDVHVRRAVLEADAAPHDRTALIRV